MMVMLSSTNFFWGVGAALFAPFLMVVGFMIWDDHWTKKNGSAFSLNMFKCNLTAIWFLIVIVAMNIADEAEQLSVSSTTLSVTASMKMICDKLNPFKNENVKFLMASSTVGILIGDWTWIEGLKYLGARKVIVMDSLKPFLAALAGKAFFDEKFVDPMKASIGLVLTVVGVALVGLEVEGEEGGDDCNTVSQANDCTDPIINASNTISDQRTKMDTSYQYGLFMAVSNVVLHTLGVTLTKKFGTEMTTWEINFVRFGFSGVCMLLLTLLLLIRDRISLFRRGPPKPYSAVPGTQNYGSISITSILPSVSSPHNDDTNKEENPWYTLPKLSRSSWIRVTFGVAFVSFLSPALTNYAMFQIPLALLLTLESIGPLYSLPLALLMQKEYPSFRASVGAVLAVSGIALLSFEGKQV